MSLNYIYLIIYLIAYNKSYRLLRKEWNKDFGTSWSGVFICGVGALVLWTPLFVCDDFRLRVIEMFKFKSKPPKWL